VLVEKAAAVPAAFERLVTVGALARVVATLDEDVARAVVRAVAQRYGLAVRDDEPGSSPMPDRARAPETARRAMTARIVAAVAPEAVMLAAPVHARRLAALALVVRRAPAVARSPGFAGALAATVPARGDVGEQAPPLARITSASAPITLAPPAAVAVPHARTPDSPAERSAGEPPDGPARILAQPAKRSAHVEHRDEPPPPPAAGAEPAPSIHTALGGVLFLTNLLTAQGIFGDFTQPRDEGPGVDFWRVLSLLGVRLLARRPQRRDRVWPLLRELAGPDAPGAPDADRLVADLARQIRRRLRADGVAVDTLLRRAARVEVTDTRLDATFELAGHPIGIRLAGLDRDPGFVPAAGRTIAFHFE
jgi:hypothetical protein